MKRVKELKVAQAANEAQAAPNWKQEVCIFESARAGSAVALAMQRQFGASSTVVERVERVAAVPLPSSVQDESDASLLKPLDPTRLVGSRGKGPIKPRLRVHLRKAPFHLNMLWQHLLTLCQAPTAESIVATPSPGVRWRQETSCARRQLRRAAVSAG